MPIEQFVLRRLQPFVLPLQFSSTGSNGRRLLQEVLASILRIACDDGRVQCRLEIIAEGEYKIIVDNDSDKIDESLARY